MTVLLTTNITNASGPNFTQSIPFPLGVFQTPPAKLTLQGKFTAAGGGTTVDAFVQTSFDNGVTWIDIASFAFATTSLTEIFNLASVTVAATPIIPTTGALAANTALSGLLGPVLRVQWSSTGTYSAGTSLELDAVPG